MIDRNTNTPCRLGHGHHFVVHKKVDKFESFVQFNVFKVKPCSATRNAASANFSHFQTKREYILQRALNHHEGVASIYKIPCLSRLHNPIPFCSFTPLDNVCCAKPHQALEHYFHSRPSYDWLSHSRAAWSGVPLQERWTLTFPH